MPKVIEDLEVRVGYDGTAFSRGIRKATRIIKRFAKRITGVAKRISRAFLSMNSAILGAAGIAGIGLLVKSSLDAVDEMAKLSRVLALSTQELAVFKLAAEIGGSSLDTFARASRQVSKNVFDFVIRGTGEASDSFKALGIDVTDLQPIMNDQLALLGLIADRFKEMPDGAIKTAAAVKLFGGRASEMLNVLAGGSEELKRFAEEARSFGNILSDKAVVGIEKANDAMTRLKFLFTGARDQIVAALAPAIENLANMFRDRLVSAVDQSGLTIEAFAQETALSILNMIRRINNAIFDFTAGAIGLVQGIQEKFEGLGRFNPFADVRRDIRDLNIEFKDLPLAERLAELQKQAEEAPAPFGSNFLAGLKKTQDAFNATIDNLIKGTQNYAAGAVPASKLAAAAFEEGFKSIKAVGSSTFASLEDQTARFFRTGKFGFKSFVDAALNELSRLAASNFLGSIFGKSDGGGASFFAGLFKSIGGGMAGGGAVSPGSIIPVGERGFENIVGKGLFIPTAPSVVINNADTRRGMGANITINQEMVFNPGMSNVEIAMVQNAIQVSQQATYRAVFDTLNGISR